MMPLVMTNRKVASAQDWYRSQEVVRETGATARQLQWWDERRILSPERMDAHCRLYSRGQIEIIRRLIALRKAGVSLQDIRSRKLLTLPWKTVTASRKPVLVGDVLFVPL